MRLALYQPDIAPNVGTLLRLGACLGVHVDIIEPCGFPFGAKDLRRSVMDYADSVDVTRHISWEKFTHSLSDQRIILLSTQSASAYTDFSYRDSDVLLLGRESAGVPKEIHESVDHRVVIPMNVGMRSVNVAIAAAMVLGEGLRQTEQFPPSPILPSNDGTQ